MRVDEHTIEVAEAPVFYRSASAPGTPVLYLHGIPTSSADWVPFLERTGGIAPDLIGFGASAKAGHLDYSLDGHADFIARLLDELDVDRVMLVAHDWGAGGGLTFAQRHPERIERLALINALPLVEGFAWPRAARLLRRAAIGELLMGSTNRWLLARTLRAGTVSADAWPEARIDTIWAQFDQGTQRAILRLLRSTDEQRLAAAGTGLRSLDMPAQVVWGTRDPWLPVELASAYAQRLPQAAQAQLDGAGHWPWLDRPEVVDRVVEFLTAR